MFKQRTAYEVSACLGGSGMGIRDSPKGVRDIFDITPGDTLLMLADKNQGIAIVRNDVYMNFADALFEAQRRAPEEAEE